jgi:hypothetical protein
VPTTVSLGSSFIIMITFLLAVTGLWMGAFTCLLICVDQNDKGLLGRLRSAVFDALPAALERISSRLLGARITGFFKGIKHYLVETNHPLVQIFYLIIAVGGFAAYDYYGLFDAKLGRGFGMHRVLANSLALVSFYTYYRACSTPPGCNSKLGEAANIQMFKGFYDGILYKAKNECKTCGLVKPARSKHCSLCGCCVLKFDHHCIWIRQCVGLQNYKWFLAFLLQHAIWCLYLGVLAISMLGSFILRERLLEAVFTVNGHNIPADWAIVLQFMLFHHLPVMFLAIMTLVMGSSLVVFFLYHCFLVAKGCTTSEKIKRSDALDFFTRRERYLAGRPELLEQADTQKELELIQKDRATLKAFAPRGLRQEVAEVLWA